MKRVVVPKSAKSMADIHDESDSLPVLHELAGAQIDMPETSLEGRKAEFRVSDCHSVLTICRMDDYHSNGNSVPWVADRRSTQSADFHISRLVILPSFRYEQHISLCCVTTDHVRALLCCVSTDHLIVTVTDEADDHFFRWAVWLSVV
jgi:hypothetical protein